MVLEVLVSDYVYGIRYQLGQELNALRVQRRMSLADVARSLHASQSAVSRQLSGTRTVSWVTARALIELFGVTGDERTRLLDMAVESAKHPSLNREFRPLLTDTEMVYYEALMAAEEVRINSQTLVPFPLRTPEYERTIWSTRPAAQAASTKGRVRLLVHVNQQLHSSDSVVTMVMSEAALYHCDRAQLRHMADLSDRYSIRLNLLSSGITRSNLGAFTLLLWPTEPMQNMVTLWQGLEPPLNVRTVAEVTQIEDDWHTMAATEPDDFKDLIHRHLSAREG